MAALEPVDRVSFVVEVLSVRNGKRLSRVRPDEQGYYTIPMAVIGTPTDNVTYYEVNEFVGQMTRPDTFINRLLTDGKLFGEYGHPMIRFMPENDQISRLMMLDEKCISHHIKKLWTGETLSNGGKILYGLVKPSGPYGSFLRDSLDDPCINTSFSLRSVAHSRVVNGLTRRKIQALITFDFVCAGGYNEASKRFSPSVENLNMNETMLDLPITPIQLPAVEYALENLTPSEMRDIFGGGYVTIGRQKIIYDKSTEAVVDDTGKERSIYSKLLES